MEQDLIKKIEEQGLKIDAIYKSVEKTRKYFQITLWVTLITIVLPMIGLLFAIPLLMSSYSSLLGGGVLGL